MSNAKHGLALNWIGGAWVGASDVRPSIDPATYAVIGEYADGGLKAAHKAVETAKRAFRETAWALDHELRARVLGQIADAFERNRDALLDLLATENGKVKGEAAFEVDMAPSKLRLGLRPIAGTRGRDRYQRSKEHETLWIDQMERRFA